MPNWKKVILSGSNAVLASITASGGIRTAGDLSASGHLFAKLDSDIGAESDNVVSYDTLTGKFFITGAYSQAGGGPTFPYSGSDVFDPDNNNPPAVITGSLIVGGELGGNITASGELSASSIKVNNQVSASTFTGNLEGGFTIGLSTNDTHVFSIPFVSSSLSNTYVAQPFRDGILTYNPRSQELLTTNLEVTNIADINEADITSAVIDHLTASFADINIISSSIISASNSITASNLLVTNFLDAASFNVFGTSLFDNQVSVISGSTIFGSASDNTHQFTGSLFVSGNINVGRWDSTLPAGEPKVNVRVKGDISASAAKIENALNANILTAASIISTPGTVSAGNINAAGGTITASNVVVSDTLNSNIISTSGSDNMLLKFEEGNTFAIRQSATNKLIINDISTTISSNFTASAKNKFGDAGTDLHHFFGDISQSLGNISSSGFLHVSATQHTPDTNSPIVAMYDTGSGRLYYTSSDAIGGGAGFPYVGSDSLTGSPQQAIITGSLFLSGSGHITASGGIRALDGNVIFEETVEDIGELFVDGHITASGNVRVDGHLSSSKIILNNNIGLVAIADSNHHSLIIRNKQKNTLTSDGPRLVLDCNNSEAGSRQSIPRGSIIGLIGTTGRAYQATWDGNDSKFTTIIRSVATETHSGGKAGTQLEFTVAAKESTTNFPILTLNHESGSLFTGSISQKAGPIVLPAIGETFDTGALDYGTRETDLAYMVSASKIGNHLRNYETETGNVFLSSSIGTDGDLCPILFKTPSRNTSVECNITLTFFDFDKIPFNTLQSSLNLIWRSGSGMSPVPSCSFSSNEETEFYSVQEPIITELNDGKGFTPNADSYQLASGEFIAPSTLDDADIFGSQKYFDTSRVFQAVGFEEDNGIQYIGLQYKPQKTSDTDGGASVLAQTPFHAHIKYKVSRHNF